MIINSQPGWKISAVCNVEPIGMEFRHYGRDPFEVSLATGFDLIRANKIPSMDCGGQLLLIFKDGSKTLAYPRWRENASGERTYIRLENAGNREIVAAQAK